MPEDKRLGAVDADSIGSDHSDADKHVLLESVEGTDVFKLDSRADRGSTYGTLRQALLAALDYLAGLTGVNSNMGTVHLPYGRFSTPQSVICNTGRFETQDGTGSLKILGKGAMADGGTDVVPGTVFVSDITDGTIVFTTDDGTGAEQGPEHLELEGIAVAGNSNEGTAIRFTGGDEGEMRHCGAYAVGGTGFENYSSQTGRFVNNTARRCGGGGIANFGKYEGYNNEYTQGGIDNWAIRNKGSFSETFADIEAASATGPVVNCKSGGTTLYDSSVSGGAWSVASDDSGGITLRDTTLTYFDSEAIRFRDTGSTRNLSTVDNCRSRPATGANAHFNFVGGNVRLSGVRLDERDVTDPFPLSSGNSDGVDIDWPDAPAFNGEVGVAPASSAYTVTFDRPFTQKPAVEIRNVEGGVSYQGTANWTTNADGNYTGVDLNFSGTPTALTWKARPQNVRA